jgi:alkylresorcinol/alkylpyrone synthase
MKGQLLPFPRAHLLSLATAVPPHVLEQAQVTERVAEIYASRIPDFRKVAQVFANCGVQRRYAVRPLDWYCDPHGWPDRTAVYFEAAAELFAAAARKGLERAGIEAADVDAIVTISSTGIATPSLDARAAGRIGFRPNIERVPVFGLGCAGGVTGLSLAARLAEARPGTNVLMVAVELCTLAVRLDRTSMADIVALALFGDGAAAAVVRAGEGGLAKIQATKEHTWPDTLGVMGWDIEPEGFGVVLDRAVPAFASEQLAPVVASILKAQGLEHREIGRFLCHPGSSKVIEAVEEALEVQTGGLDLERAVLSDFGNMSAPTALFILERALQRGLPPIAMLMAMGPGFTLSTATLARSAA